MSTVQEIQAAIPKLSAKELVFRFTIIWENTIVKIWENPF
jgi:hypothetical protein